MSGHHSCMQMLQLFDIPNMQWLQRQKNKKSPGKKYVSSNKSISQKIKKFS